MTTIKATPLYGGILGKALDGTASGYSIPLLPDGDVRVDVPRVRGKNDFSLLRIAGRWFVEDCLSRRPLPDSESASIERSQQVLRNREQQLTAWMCMARRRGYAAPSDEQIDRYRRLCLRAEQLGVAPRSIITSRDACNGDEWVTSRGIENEIASLLHRCNNAGHDLEAEDREERINSCPDCALARSTGMHPSERMVSHEEGQCRRCGAYYLHPDVD